MSMVHVSEKLEIVGIHSAKRRIKFHNVRFAQQEGRVIVMSRSCQVLSSWHPITSVTNSWESECRGWSAA